MSSSSVAVSSTRRMPGLGNTGRESVTASREVKETRDGEEVKEVLKVTHPDGTTETREETVKVTTTEAPRPEIRVTKLINTRNHSWSSVEFIVYLVVTVIALVVVWVIGSVSDSTSYWNSLSRPSYGSNLAWQGVILTIAVLVLGTASFLLTGGLDPVSGAAARIYMYVMYGLQLVFLIIAVAVLFRQKSLSATFYLFIVLVIITFLQALGALYILFRTKAMPLIWLALFLWVLFVAWLVYDTVFSYNLMQQN